MFRYLSISHRLLTKYLNDGIFYSTYAMKQLFPDRFEYLKDQVLYHIPLMDDISFLDESYLIIELDLSDLNKTPKYNKIIPITSIKSIYCKSEEIKKKITPHIRDVEINTDYLLTTIKVLSEDKFVLSDTIKIKNSRADNTTTQYLLFYFQIIGGVSFLKGSKLLTKNKSVHSLGSFYREYINIRI